MPNPKKEIDMDALNAITDRVLSYTPPPRPEKKKKRFERCQRWWVAVRRDGSGSSGRTCAGLGIERVNWTAEGLSGGVVTTTSNISCIII